MKLFASILRREQDNHYYLLTPVEKWRIRVDDRPLMIVAMQLINPAQANQQIIFTSNVDDSYLLSVNYPLSVLTDSVSGEPDPFLSVDNNLTAKLNRAVYYQLADYAGYKNGKYFLLSDGAEYVIG